MIRQKYYITHFHFDNKLLIKQKSLIRKSIIFYFMMIEDFHLNNTTIV